MAFVISETGVESSPGIAGGAFSGDASLSAEASTTLGPVSSVVLECFTLGVFTVFDLVDFIHLHFEKSIERFVRASGTNDRADSYARSCVYNIEAYAPNGIVVREFHCENVPLRNKANSAGVAARRVERFYCEMNSNSNTVMRLGYGRVPTNEENTAT
jgi:hypothetical protein